LPKLVKQALLSASIQLAASAVAHAETVMQIVANHVQQGSTLSVVVRASSDVPLAGINGEILIPPGLSLTTVEAGALLQPPDFKLAYQAVPGSLRFISWSPTESFRDPGTTLVLHMSASQTVTGLVEIAFSEVNPVAFVNSRHAASDATGETSLAHSAISGYSLIYSDTSDFDGDKLPDAWEVRYGLDPLTDNTGLDSDGDGVSDLDEFLAGTDPSNPASRPRCTDEESIFCDGFESPAAS